MSNELLYKPGIELIKLIKKKEISPVELTKLSLRRIEETEPKINAFFTVMHDQAINKAKEIEKKMFACNWEQYNEDLKQDVWQMFEHKEYQKKIKCKKKK